MKTGMAIFYYEFKIPFNTNDPSQIKLEDSILFANKQEVPPGHRRDITPPGYRDQYVLKTKLNTKEKDREDTVGIVEVALRGKKVSGYSIDRETGSGTLVETEANKTYFEVDSENPLFFLSRPNILDGGEGFRVNAIVRYVRSE